MPQFTFAKDPVVTTALAGTKDIFINPGALFASGGTLHLFPNSFTNWPGRMLVPHLTSTDGGTTWTLDTSFKAIDTSTFKLADPGIDVSTGFITADGTWVIVYENVSVLDPWVIARATAPGPTGPWTVESTPILTPGAAGSWDAGGVEWPSVVKVGNRWAMYYAGVDKPAGAGTGAIGVAFSDDGKTWVKQPAPVLQADQPWEHKTIGRPRVVSTPSGYVMLYTGLDITQRGLATSPDGLTWTSLPGPSIDRSDFPITGGSWDSALMAGDGQLVYFLEIGDGVSFTKDFRGTLPWP